jgi:peroxidase
MMKKALLCITLTSGGKLASSGPSLLPIVNGAFKAGDTRVIENPALTTMHTLFMREHNRLAQLIQNKFPTWSEHHKTSFLCH